MVAFNAMQLTSDFVAFDIYQLKIHLNILYILIHFESDASQNCVYLLVSGNNLSV